MQTFRKLLSLLTSVEKKNAVFLLIMITIMALLDTIGVASILPFIAVLTNPNLIETNIFLSSLFKISNMFGVKTIPEFLFALGITVFVILIISLTFKALTTYVQLRFVLMREYSIGKRLLEVYLNQRYSWFLSRNSADLGKNILSEAQIVARSGIGSLMELISKGMIVITLIALLIVVNPKIALAVGLLLGFAYLFIFYFVHNHLNQIGKKRLKNNQLRFKTISEAFGAAKEVKVGGLEETYVKNFSNSAQIYAQTQSSSQVIAQLPRFILEL